MTEGMGVIDMDGRITTHRFQFDVKNNKKA
jgi:hypothetical protein